MLLDADGRLVQDFRLDVAASQLYADGFHADHRGVASLLRSLLAHTRQLLRTAAGSVSVVDVGAGSYAKVAERGVPCRMGHAFPLDEGVTGRAVSRRRPVVLDDYRRVDAGHLPVDHPARHGAVAAVPIWWRGDVLGVNVVFAGDRHRFTGAEVDALEILSQSAAPALRSAGGTVGGLLRSSGTVAAVPGRPPSPFTPRQQEVLALLAEGRSDRDIAAALVLSPKTVEKHVGALLRRTGTTTRTGAVVRSIERGWLTAG